MYIDKSIIKIIDHWFKDLTFEHYWKQVQLRVWLYLCVRTCLYSVYLHHYRNPISSFSGTGRRFTGKRGSRIEDRGSRIEDRGSSIEHRASRIEDQISKIEVGGWRVGDQKSGIGDRGLVEKTWKNRGSWWCGPQTVDKFHKKISPARCTER